MPTTATDPTVAEQKLIELAARGETVDFCVPAEIEDYPRNDSAKGEHWRNVRCRLR
jgi:hypothetical protein